MRFPPITQLVTCMPAREFMRALPDRSVQLIWTDPPFGTGNTQTLVSNGLTYVDDVPPTTLLAELEDDIVRVLTNTGVLVVCLDYRFVHDVIVQLRRRLTFHGEVIWHFELGGTSKSWWSNKHNTLAIFSRGNPFFNYDAVPETIRKAGTYGKLGTAKKVTSVWNLTMSNSDPQRVGYPSQKPVEIVLPFVAVHTNPSDLVVDPFAGSGTVGAAALTCGRRYAVNDVSADAFNVMSTRLVGERTSL